MGDFENCNSYAEVCACILGKFVGLVAKYSIFWWAGKIILGL